jgi:trk system potassium uptake protein
MADVSGAGQRRPLLRHPAQVVVVAFAGAIACGTLLLLLPVSRSGEGGASFVEALFTATSAVCVTGLIVVDTPTYWSGFGEAVILGLIQVGGFGIMTLASLLGLFVSRRLGLKSRLTAAAETKAVGIGDVRSIIKGVFRVTIAFELVVWVILTLRFALAYDESWGRATYDGLFHSVSAFNNAGFSLNSDSLMAYVTDPWVCLPIAIAVIAGGLGFPVWLELARHYRSPKKWSLHTTMTVSVSGALLLIGFVFVTANEWNNPGTLGGLSSPGRLLAGFFQAVMPRTAGFNSVDTGALSDSTLLGTCVLMFIGGGSAGTAGGIKVTTFMLLFWVIFAEVRGERDVVSHERRIDDRAIRQALTVALLGVAAVMVTTLALLEMTDHSTNRVLFEATSAFGTVGLSTGITGELPAAGQLLLTALMFLGRLGPITLVSALALRERRQLYRYPEGRPIIG